MLASFVYMIHRLVQQKQCWLHLSIWYTDWYSRNNVGFICLYDTPTGTAETMLASFVYMIHRLVQQKQCWLHLSIWYTDWYSRNNAGFICLYDTPTGTAETMLASFGYMIHRLVQQKQCWLHLTRQMKPALFLLYQSVYHLDKWSQHCFCCTSRCII
jgi:hypothetical protein